MSLHVFVSLWNVRDHILHRAGSRKGWGQTTPHKLQPAVVWYYSNLSECWGLRLVGRNRSCYGCGAAVLALSTCKSQLWHAARPSMSCYASSHHLRHVGGDCNKIRTPLIQIYLLWEVEFSYERDTEGDTGLKYLALDEELELCAWYSQPTSKSSSFVSNTGIKNELQRLTAKLLLPQSFLLFIRRLQGRRAEVGHDHEELLEADFLVRTGLFLMLVPGSQKGKIDI